MNDAILVSTRKGLFKVFHTAGCWDIDGVDFLDAVMGREQSQIGWLSLSMMVFGMESERSAPSIREEQPWNILPESTCL